MAEGFDRYPMDAEPRGYCVIFNNINFNQDFLTTREGSQKDADDLENLFSYKLGFKVLRYNDMSETEMMLNMEALRERDHGIFCALVLIILSHGDRGIIYSSDSKKIPIKNISNMFTAINCPSLMGKPKIFIIQACQGYESMKAIAARSYPNEYLTRPTRVVLDGILIDSDTIPNEADFLFAFATISGHTAMRDIYDGGWYIQELVKSLDKYSNIKSVTEILTNVAAQTAKYQYDQKTQLPPYQSGLLKTLYFPNATRYHMTGSTLQESKRSIVFSRSTLSLRSIPSDSELTTSKNNSTSSLKFINTSTLPGSPCLVKQNRKRHSTDPASLSLSPCVRSQQSLRRLNTTPSIITALPMQQKVNPNFQNDEHNSPITKSRKIPLTNPFSISQRSLSGVTSAHDIIKPSSTPSTGHSTPSTSITDIHVPHDRVLKIESPPITIINKSDITPTSPQNLQTFNKAEIQSQTSTDSSQRSLQESLLQVPVYSKSETVSQATSRSESSPFSSKENLDVKENVCEKSTENIEAKIVAYKMTSIPCGYCILIDNHNTDATVTAVKNARNVLCIDYGFHVENFSNLSRKGIKQLMKAVSRVDHNNLNCLMVIILSHGGKEKGIYDTHGKQISVEDVTETFSIEKCPSLKKKPKIFFFETILNNTAIVSTCSSIHYPDMRDTHTCTIVCSTTESASVLCLQIMAETLQMQLDSAQFVNIVRDVEKLLYEKQIRNVDIETNNFLEQPLIFPRRQKIDNREEEGRFVAIEIKMALRVWSQMRNITIEKIRKNRERIIKVCKEVRRIKIAGSATSIAGGVLTVLGLGLTPVTLGGSIAISVVGGSIALAGGAASVSATVFNKIMSKSKLRKVQDIIEVDQQLCRIIEILEENLQRIAEDIQRYHLDTDKKDIVVALLHGSKLVQITSVVAKGGVAGSQVARIGGTTAIQGGLFAFRLGSTAVRGVAIAGGIVSLLILPFDIYELTTNAYKIHKHSESKSACMQWLNEQLEKLTTQKQEIEICLEEIERRNSESTSSYSTEV